MSIVKSYYKADEISKIMDISIASAYRVIRTLNDELKASGYLVLPGRVNKSFFEKKTGYTLDFGGTNASL